MRCRREVGDREGEQVVEEVRVVAGVKVPAAGAAWEAPVVFASAPTAATGFPMKGVFRADRFSAPSVGPLW